MSFLYSAYGVSFALPFRATTRLEPARSRPELALREITSSTPHARQLVYDSPVRLADGAAAARYWRGDRGDVFSITRAVEFRGLNGPTVRFRRLAALSDEEVEGYILSALLPLRFDLAGWLSFHCAAVGIGDGVVGLLGESGAGKSTLAAALLWRGHASVSEDVIPVEVGESGEAGCLAGYPECKLDDVAGAHFLGERIKSLRREPHPGGKRRVPLGEGGFAQFASGRHRLASLLVLDRRGRGDCMLGIRRVEKRRATIELLRHSFHSRLVDALGLAPVRLKKLAALVETVPVFQLQYPSGLEHLDEVCTLIEDRIG